MRFEVTRTSDYGLHKPRPCAEAGHSILTRVDHSSFASPEAYEAGLPHMYPWLSCGTNHRVVDDGIERDILEKGWIMELEGLVELMSFIDEQGEVIISEGRHEYPTIEIYDGCRE